MPQINKSWKIAGAVLLMVAVAIVAGPWLLEHAVKRKHAQTIWADGHGYLSCEGDAHVTGEGNGRYAVSFTVPTGYHGENHVELHGIEKVQIEDAPQDEVSASCRQ